MTETQAVLLGVLLAAVTLALILGAVLLIRYLRMRRLEKRWKASGWDYKLTVLPPRCTCCPIHGPTTAESRL